MRDQFALSVYGAYPPPPVRSFPPLPKEAPPVTKPSASVARPGLDELGFASGHNSRQPPPAHGASSAKRRATPADLRHGMGTSSLWRPQSLSPKPPPLLMDGRTSAPPAPPAHQSSSPLARLSSAPSAVPGRHSSPTVLPPAPLVQPPPAHSGEPQNLVLQTKADKIPPRPPPSASAFTPGRSHTFLSVANLLSHNPTSHSSSPRQTVTEQLLANHKAFVKSEQLPQHHPPPLPPPPPQQQLRPQQPPPQPPSQLSNVINLMPSAPLPPPPPPAAAVKTEPSVSQPQPVFWEPPARDTHSANSSPITVASNSSGTPSAPHLKKKWLAAYTDTDDNATSTPLTPTIVADTKPTPPLNGFEVDSKVTVNGNSNSTLSVKSELGVTGTTPIPSSAMSDKVQLSSDGSGSETDESKSNKSQAAKSDAKAKKRAASARDKKPKKSKQSNDEDEEERGKKKLAKKEKKMGKRPAKDVAESAGQMATSDSESSAKSPKSKAKRGRKPKAALEAAAAAAAAAATPAKDSTVVAPAATVPAAATAVTPKSEKKSEKKEKPREHVELVELKSGLKKESKIKFLKECGKRFLQFGKCNEVAPKLTKCRECQVRVRFDSIFHMNRSRPKIVAMHSKHLLTRRVLPSSSAK